jgi:hypothetical protein
VGLPWGGADGALPLAALLLFGALLLGALLLGALLFGALPMGALPFAAPLFRTGRLSGAGRRRGSGAELGLRSVTLMYRNARAAKAPSFRDVRTDTAD